MPQNASTWFERSRKFFRIAHEELEALYPLKVLAEATSAALPQQTFNRTRTAMIRAAGVRVGEHSLILGALRLTGIGDTCRLLSIGSNTIVTGPLHVDLGAPVHIGDWVRIGHDVSLLTVNHEIGTDWLRSGTSFFGSIEIGRGAWIASRVTVLPGVKIGAASVVAAGAVVTRDVPDNGLVAGVPARLVRTLPPEGDPRRNDMHHDSDGHPPESVRFHDRSRARRSFES